jgi:glycosyltransferase involved in cell wall biosynthesis
MVGVDRYEEVVQEAFEPRQPERLRPWVAKPDGRIPGELIDAIGHHEGGIPETIIDGETGVLFDPDIPDAFVTSVSNALSDLERARAIAANGRRRILREFSLDQYIHSLVEAYVD